MRRRRPGSRNARDTLAVATGLSDGCTEDAPDVTLAKALDKRPTLAERVRAANYAHVRLVEETDEQAATLIFFGEAREEPRPSSS